MTGLVILIGFFIIIILLALKFILNELEEIKAILKRKWSS